MARYDDINTRSLFLATTVSALVVVLVVLGIRVLYFAMQERQEARKLLQTEYVSSQTHLARQAEALEEYGVDAESGRIVMPISRAMEVITQRSASQQKAEDKGVSAPDEA